MRVVLSFALFLALLIGCAAGVEGDPVAACEAQGFRAGTEEYRVCIDAGGAQIATGPGSPNHLLKNMED